MSLKIKEKLRPVSQENITYPQCGPVLIVKEFPNLFLLKFLNLRKLYYLYPS